VFFRTSIHSERLLWALTAVLLSAVGFLPLFAGPTYEFALATGVLLPLLGAGFSAWSAVTRRATPRDAFHRGHASGWVLVLLAVLIAALHTVRAGPCDPLAEGAYFLVGPLPGVLLGAIGGALCGAFLAGPLAANSAERPSKRRRALAVVLGIALPLGGVAFSFARYYTSPIIFAFDHFAGFFSGTLYDTTIDALPRLCSYRVGTFGWAVLAYAAAALSTRNDEGRLVCQGYEQRRTWALGAAGLALGVGMTLAGPLLGHYQTDASVQAALDRSALSERCRVVYGDGIRSRDALVLAQECDGYVRQHEQFFEVQAPAQITVYLFNSSEQKAWFMGARDVYIAKPWREEIYIQVRGFPHPVVGHELAHVVAGAFGVGPFKVAGPLGGWIPDPGRIEGVAVAAAPREDDELSLLQWSRAMRDLELLPPLRSVFRLGFLGENSSKAYTVAGAFITFLKQRNGAAAVRGWYAGQSLPALTGKSLDELDVEFRASLDQVDVSDVARAVAKARFDRPGLFARTCPHQVDATLDEANTALGSSNPDKARGLYEKVRSLAPDEFWALVGLGSCDVRQRKLAEARARYQALLDSKDRPATATERAWLHEQLGDLSFLENDLQQAQARYAEAKALIVDQDGQRTLTLKQSVLVDGNNAALARSAVRALLIGDPELGANFAVAAAELGRWAQATGSDGLPDYLLGRNHASRGEWAWAAEELDRALGRGLGLELFSSEALRTRLFMGCALGQKDAAQKALDGYLAVQSVSPARRWGVLRFAERCGLSAPPSDSAGANPVRP
jgi:tetratricopeptide (TPR) repeat protein